MGAEVLCPACGEANPPRARFCLGCGTALAAPSQGPPGSRRLVTVVFTDIVGSVVLGERLDEESLQAVMDAFYGRMREAIAAEHGTLARFVGDAVLAVWGVPEIHEDDAQRAVRGAERIRQAVGSLNTELEQRWGVRIGVRTGVNTGEVVVDPSRPADLLAGDAVNTAARLQTAAGAGEVLMGPDTYRLVRGAAVVEAVGPVLAKGKAAPLHAWRLVDGLSGDGRAATRLEAPVIGRVVELDRLKSAFEATATARRCRLVTIVGSPGVGKTRLVEEFAHRLGNDATVLRGQCVPTGEGLTFLPVVEALRTAAGIGEDEGATVVHERLEAVLTAEDADRPRVVSIASALLGAGSPPGTDEAFWAVRRMLEAAAARRPVLLLLDDLHWAEPTFLDLIEYLVEWIAEAPVLVVGASRPELHELRPPFVTPPGVVFEVISLEPLAATDGRMLMASLLGSEAVPPVLADRVLETAAGNPLFLSETLRMLIDEGLLRREGRDWIVEGEADAVVVPPTINALLASRMERLPSDQRVVIERAAVIGERFYPGAVAELSPDPLRPEVGPALTALARKELVRPEHEWWLEEHVHRFQHALIRDAAYNTLLKASRAELHERYADWLDSKTGDIDELAGFHLERAYAYRAELAPLDESGHALGARAAHRLYAAGRRALERDDLSAAANLISRALVPCPPASRGDLWVDLCETLLSAGEVQAAREPIRQLTAANEPRLVAWGQAFEAQLAALLGSEHVARSVDLASDAADRLTELGDLFGAAKAHQVVAQLQASLGQVGAAQDALDRALAAARQAGDGRRLRLVLAAAAREYLWGPIPVVRALGHCLDIIRIARGATGSLVVEATSIRTQAVLEAMRDRVDRARELLRQSRAIFEELGLTLELHENDISEGVVELLGGDPSAAEERLRAAREGLAGLGVEARAAQAAALQGRALVELGQEQAAVAATVFAEEHTGGDLKTAITWLAARGQALARGGRLDEARQLAVRAVDLAASTDALPDKADALMALAAVETAAGAEARAREAASRARELYEAKGHVVGAARAAGFGGVAPDASPKDTGRHHRDVHPEVYAAVRAWTRAFNERDWKAARATMAETIRGVDLRQLGSAAVNRTGDEAVEMFRTITEQAPGVYFQADVLAGETLPGGLRIGAYLGTYRIDGEGGMELPTGIVGASLHGRTFLSENLDPDPQAILARYDALREELSTPDPPEGWAQAAETSRAVAGHLVFVEAFNAGDWERIRRMCAPDWVNIDTQHLGLRTMSLGEMIAEATAARESGVMLRFVPQRLLACSSNVFAATQILQVRTAEGDAGEFHYGLIGPYRDGLALFSESYELDDARTLERFEALAVEHDGAVAPLRVERLAHAPQAATQITATATHEKRLIGGDASRDEALERATRFARAFNDRDWEEIALMYSDSHISRDGRTTVSAAEQFGRGGFVNSLKGVVATIPSVRAAGFEILAATHVGEATLVSAVISTYSMSTDDTADTGAAPGELQMGVVAIVRHGIAVLSEQCDPEPDRVLARYNAILTQLQDSPEV